MRGRSGGGRSRREGDVAEVALSAQDACTLCRGGDGCSHGGCQRRRANGAREARGGGGVRPSRARDTCGGSARVTGDHRRVLGADLQDQQRKRGRVGRECLYERRQRGAPNGVCSDRYVTPANMAATTIKTTTKGLT